MASHKGALARVTELVKGREIRDADRTERLALFELYGTICGDAGVAVLDAMLNGPQGSFQAQVRSRGAVVGGGRAEPDWNARGSRDARALPRGEGSCRAPRRRARTWGDALVTGPPRGGRGTASVPLEKGSEAYVRSLGRAFVLAFCGALRNVRMYPAENPVVQRSLHELTALSTELLGDDDELELRVAGEFLFINQTRLRLDLDNYATINYLIAQLRASGTGMVRAVAVPTPAEWTALVTALNSPQGDDPVSRHHHLHHRLAAAGVNVFELEPPVKAEMGGSDQRGAANDPAKGAYAKSVAAASEVMAAVAIGQSPNLKVVKRTVQLIVDRILSEQRRRCSASPRCATIRIRRSRTRSTSASSRSRWGAAWDSRVCSCTILGSPRSFTTAGSHGCRRAFSTKSDR